MKGIDHLVLCGRNHLAMRESFSALGFTLTPQAQHPFGTGNSLVQLEECFVELLSVFEAGKIPAHEARHFSFAAFNRDFLAEREGMSMLVLDSSNARADAAAFRSAGLKTYEPFQFSRKARLPDGREATVGFTLAFVTDPAMPDVAFFTSQQHAPEHFWKPDYQRHANRAVTIVDVSLVAERPQEHAAFLSAFTGVPAIASDNGITLRTGRGNVSCITPKSFERSFLRASPDVSRGPRFGGITIGVRRIERLADSISSSRFVLQQDGPHRAVLSVDVNGIALAFFALNRQDADDER